MKIKGDEKLKRGETRAEVTKYAMSGLDRKTLYNTLENKLTNNPDKKSQWLTFSSIIGVAKQICTTNLVTECNKDGREQALVWMGDHIYTIHNKEFINSVKECLYTFDKGVDIKELPGNIIAELDLNDNDTLKLIHSTK